MSPFYFGVGIYFLVYVELSTKYEGEHYVKHYAVQKQHCLDKNRIPKDRPCYFYRQSVEGIILLVSFGLTRFYLFR